ncbi:class I SAM-dependent methyltransferase [Phytomonospora sp. NPDC050363]|uniref:class I SAM-dependent methyltransferase n=1 Tax=Phytomonospora sp. NPDC050363 TaxID=3155642 RepID=UPI0033C67058
MSRYDEYAESYDSYKESATLVIPERALFERLTGDVEGRTAVDLACGTGYYTRNLRRRGAVDVLGVDLSRRMIEIATAREAAENLGIDYRVGDGTALPHTKAADLVTAVYLFPYATTTGDLAGMFTSARACLHKGGRLVALTVDSDFEPRPDLAEYGWTDARFEDADGHRKITIRFLGDPPADLVNHQWPRGAYQRAAREAGFANLAWHPLEIPPGAVAGYGEAYWRELLENPFITGLTAEAVLAGLGLLGWVCWAGFAGRRLTKSPAR